MLFRFAGFELDQQRASLRGPDGRAIKLRPKAFEMLRLFVTAAGRVLTKQELMEAVWPNVHVGEDSLFQCIREIRAALGDEARQTIRLASGGGYIFTPDVSVPPADPPARAEAIDAAAADPAVPAAPAEAAPIRRRPRVFGLRGRAAAVAAAVGIGTIIALAAAAQAFRPDFMFKRMPPIVAVLPIVDASDDPHGAATAREVSARLAEGFVRIDGIRVIAPILPTEVGAEPVSAPAVTPDYELRGELQRDRQAWTLRARMIKPATGEVQAVAVVTVDGELAEPLLQSRLAAGAGHVIARRLNALRESDAAMAAGDDATTGRARVVVEQATAAINQTTRERFGTAQTMLETSLAADPDSVDLQVALAALQLRGIQMAWYAPGERAAAVSNATALLDRAVKARPSSIPVLEAQCRLLSATNRFVESLVTCARTLSFDPWNGLALYLVGLGQLHLGRFNDALETFQLAHRYDTPAVSRWTWLIGAGWANVMLERPDEALPWLQRSVAITSASGRPQMLLAATYQQLGRTEEARAAMQEGLRLRPGTTAHSVLPPMTNTSPVFREASDRVVALMVAAGLPEK